jgi:ATP-dependent Zn protease
MHTLAQWLPFLILIGAWLFIATRMRSRNTPFQEMCAENMAAQTASQAETVRQLTRIADALEKRQG